MVSKRHAAEIFSFSDCQHWPIFDLLFHLSHLAPQGLFLISCAFSSRLHWFSLWKRTKTNNVLMDGAERSFLVQLIISYSVYYPASSEAWFWRKLFRFYFRLLPPCEVKEHRTLAWGEKAVTKDTPTVCYHCPVSFSMRTSATPGLKWTTTTPVNS